MLSKAYVFYVFRMNTTTTTNDNSNKTACPKTHSELNSKSAVLEPVKTRIVLIKLEGGTAAYIEQLFHHVTVPRRKESEHVTGERYQHGMN